MQATFSTTGVKSWATEISDNDILEGLQVDPALSCLLGPRPRLQAGAPSIQGRGRSWDWMLGTPMLILACGVSLFTVTPRWSFLSAQAEGTGSPKGVVMSWSWQAGLPSALSEGQQREPSGRHRGGDQAAGVWRVSCGRSLSPGSAQLSLLTTLPGTQHGLSRIALC